MNPTPTLPDKTMQISLIKFEKFQAAGDAGCQRRIIAAKEKLGKRLVILDRMLAAS